MKQTKYFCDKCKKEICVGLDEKTCLIKSKQFGEIYLCMDCMSLFLDWFHG